MGELLRKLLFWRTPSVAETIVSEVDGCFTLPEAIEAEAAADAACDLDDASAIEG